MDLDTICYLHSRWLLFDLKAISKISFARIRDSRCFSSLLPICVSMENPRHLEDRLKSRSKADNYGLHPYHKSEFGQDMKRSDSRWHLLPHGNPVNLDNRPNQREQRFRLKAVSMIKFARIRLLLFWSLHFVYPWKLSLPSTISKAFYFPSKLLNNPPYKWRSSGRLHWMNEISKGARYLGHWTWKWMYTG